MSMTALFDELKHNIVEKDLTQYTDDEIRKLYKDCNRAIDYYDAMQTTVKLEANSVYGACGNQYFRFFNTEIAADITTEGKLLLFEVDKLINLYFTKWSEDTDIINKLVTKFGFENFSKKNNSGGVFFTNSTVDLCNYGDTDSRYLDYGVIFELCGFSPVDNHQVVDFVLFMNTERIMPIIKAGTDKYIKERNGEVGHLIMELELMGGKAFFLAKKKYVVSKLWENGKYIAKDMKIKATGVELIQGSSTKFVKDAQRFILNRLLSPKSDIMQVFKLGNQLVKHAKQQPIETLVKSSMLNKYLEYIESDDTTLSYRKGITVMARAAATYNHLLAISGKTDKYPKIQQGNRIRWYYTSDPKFEVFAWPDGEDFPIEFAPPINYEKQIENMILKPMKRFVYGDNIDSNSFGAGVVQPNINMLIQKS